MKPYVPEWMKVSAKLSDFSVLLARIAPRSWSSTTSRGSTHAASTIAYDCRRVTRRRPRAPPVARTRPTSAARARASPGTRAGGRGRPGRRRARRGVASRPPGGSGRAAARACRAAASAASGRSSSRNQAEIGTPKPVLPASGDLLRQVGGEGAPQRGLAAPARELEPLGERRAELEHAPVEERRAELERVRHRRDVGLQEQVAGEVGANVEPLQAGDPGAVGRAEQLRGRSRPLRRTPAPRARRGARPGTPPSAVP